MKPPKKRSKRDGLLVALGIDAGKLPPQAPDLEQAVLGACMQERGAFDEVSYLKSDMFYAEAHKMIWEAIGQVHARDAHPDMLLVTEQMKQNGTLDIAGGAYYISQITNKVAGSANVDHHARIIQQMWMKREVIRISKDREREAYDEQSDVFDVLQKAEQEWATIQENLMVESTIPFSELADSELEDYDKEKPPAQSTGYESLDKLLNGGWHQGDFVIIAARPGMGKTAFEVGSILRGATEKNPLLVFQAEVSKTPFNDRFVAAHSGISLADLTARQVNDRDMKLRHNNHTAFRGLPIYVNFSSAPSVPDLRREVIRHKRLYDIKTIFLDQFNWVRLPGEKDRKEEVDEAARSLRRIAKDLDVTFVALHQMNRDVTNRRSHKPQLSDLRESGAFENDAQLVIFLHRPFYYGDAEDENGPTKDRADIIVAKHSSGATGVVSLRFDPETASFHDDWNTHIPPATPPTPHPDDRTDPKVDKDDLPF